MQPEDGLVQRPQADRHGSQTQREKLDGGCLRCVRACGKQYSGDTTQTEREREGGGGDGGKSERQSSCQIASPSAFVIQRQQEGEEADEEE